MGGGLFVRIVVFIAAALIAATPSFAADASKCDRQLVMQIDSAFVQVEPDGVTISAFGVVESAAWTEPTLVLGGQIANGAATVDFVACRPTAMSAQVLTPTQTKVKVALAPDVRAIVIRAKTNTMDIAIERR